MKRIYLPLAAISILSLFLISGCYTHMGSISSREEQNSRYSSGPQFEPLDRTYSIALPNFIGVTYEGYGAASMFQDPFSRPIYFWWPRMMPRFAWVSTSYSYFDYLWVDNFFSLYGTMTYGLYSPYYYQFGPYSYRKWSADAYYPTNSIMTTPIRTSIRTEDLRARTEKTADENLRYSSQSQRNSEWESESMKEFERRARYYEDGGSGNDPFYRSTYRPVIQNQQNVAPKRTVKRK